MYFIDKYFYFWNNNCPSKFSFKLLLNKKRDSFAFKIHKNIIGKANIPLNDPILNLLRQTTGIDDAINIVTYTNVNTDSTRVN